MPRYVLIDNFDGKAYGDLADLDPRLANKSQEDLSPELACRAVDYLIERTGRGYYRLEARPNDWMPNRRVPGYLVYLCEDRERVPLLFDPSDPSYIGSVKRNGVFLGYVQVIRPNDPLLGDVYDKLPALGKPDIPGWLPK